MVKMTFVDGTVVEATPEEMRESERLAEVAAEIEGKTEPDQAVGLIGKYVVFTEGFYRTPGKLYKIIGLADSIESDDSDADFYLEFVSDAGTYHSVAYPPKRSASCYEVVDKLNQGDMREFDRLGEEVQVAQMPVKFAHEQKVTSGTNKELFGLGDIVRVTVDNARWSRNEEGDIGEITEVDEADNDELPYFVSVEGHEGDKTEAWHSAKSIELVVPFERRSDK